MRIVGPATSAVGADGEGGAAPVGGAEDPAGRAEDAPGTAADPLGAGTPVRGLGCCAQAAVHTNNVARAAAKIASNRK
ncbi:MAG TPA: hypothetical protein VNO21_21300, partial [Polyangiaceae bacterium]|nr:hypothetical protein [Polyangiaceae bacterium]